MWRGKYRNWRYYDNQIGLLNALFGQLHISHAVESELNAGGRRWPGATEIGQAPWIAVHQVSDRHTVDALRLDLDISEAETIALALQLQARLVLLDEQAGRRAALHRA